MIIRTGRPRFITFLIYYSHKLIFSCFSFLILLFITAPASSAPTTPKFALSLAPSLAASPASSAPAASSQISALQQKTAALEQALAAVQAKYLSELKRNVLLQETRMLIMPAYHSLHHTCTLAHEYLLSAYSPYAHTLAWQRDT